MTPEELAALVRTGESEILEFKKSTGQRSDAAKSLCAMLNHRGGTVLFGVDANGTIVGQQVVDRTVEEVIQEIQRIEPIPYPDTARVVLDNGKEVLVVRASEGSNKPYRYRGTAYKRVGNTCLVMSSEESERVLLERLHGAHRWENDYAGEWSVDDLDINELSRSVDEAIRRGRSSEIGTRAPDDLLRGLSLTSDRKLRRAAVVLFGRSERLEADYPQCMLRVARFRGNDRTEFIDNRQFHGNAFDLLRHAERFLRDNLPVAGRIVPTLFERVDDPLYPIEALREALANAFCHRDYSLGGGSVSVGIYDDRLEITSSGALHFGLTAETLYQPHESLPWNPLIARVFYRRGLIEQWGRGTLKMAELTQLAGLPRPEILEAAGCVTVRFHPSRYLPPRRVPHDLTQRQQRILALLNANPAGLPLRELRASLDEAVQEWQVKEDLAVLKQLLLVSTHGHGRGAHWRLVNP